MVKTRDVVFWIKSLFLKTFTCPLTKKSLQLLVWGILKYNRLFYDIHSIFIRPRGPFLERPGKLTVPVSYFETEVSRKVGCVLTSNEVHFVSLAENFTGNFQKFWNSHLEWKTKQLNGPGNYRELRETGPRPGLFEKRITVSAE